MPWHSWGRRFYSIPEGAAKPNRTEVIAAFVVLALSLVVFVGRAWTDHGIFYPDEIFQSLEPAHRLGFGYGYRPWEFREGMRSWALPGLLAVPMKLAALLGVDSGLGLARATKVTIALGSVATVALAMRLGARRRTITAGIVAGFFVAFYPPFSIFAWRGMSEVVSAPFIVACALLASGEARNRYALAGALGGAATVLRYQNGVFVAALGLAIMVASLRAKPRRFEPWLAFAAGAIALFVLGGLLDWLTWGKPFHSLVAYVKQNVVENRAAHWGVHEWSFYAERLAVISGPMGWVLLALFVIGAWFERGVAFACIASVAAHSAIAHKEVRFLAPVIPCALTVAAVGVERIAHFALRTRAARIAIELPIVFGLVFATWGFVRSTKLTHGDFGTPFHDSAQRVLHSDEMQNYALSYVGRMGDACGVIVASTDLWNTGGYTYLHKQIPLLPPRDKHRTDYANYVIVADPRPPMPRYAEVKRYGNWAVMRRPDPCSAMPEFSPELN